MVSYWFYSEGVFYWLAEVPHSILDPMVINSNLL